MSKLRVLLLLAVLLMAATGCHSANSGSRQFIPGKGWVPN